MNSRTILLIFVLALAWAVAVLVNRRAVKAYRRRGEPSEGIIIFVEPIRWLFVIWGFAGFCRGLRRGGCGAQIRLFRWCTAAGSLLVVPDLAWRSRLLRQAERLAGRVSAIAARNPGCPIHLVGYSSGCYIVLEACRRITHPDVVTSVVLLAGSVSPRYSFDGTADKVGAIHSFSSAVDLINALGPAVFGTNDRRWTPACGTVGFRNPPPLVVQHRWRPADLRLGYWGDHFTICSPAFVAGAIAPIMLSARAKEPANATAELQDCG